MGAYKEVRAQPLGGLRGHQGVQVLLISGWGDDELGRGHAELASMLNSASVAWSDILTLHEVTMASHYHWS